MKYLLLIMLLLPILAQADEIFRDRYGDVIGSSTRHGDTTDYWDRYGDYTGSETKDNNGQYTIRNSWGDVVGTREEEDE